MGHPFTVKAAPKGGRSQNVAKCNISLGRLQTNDKMILNVLNVLKTIYQRVCNCIAIIITALLIL